MEGETLVPPDLEVEDLLHRTPGLEEVVEAATEGVGCAPSSGSGPSGHWIQPLPTAAVRWGSERWAKETQGVVRAVGKGDGGS